MGHISFRKKTFSLNAQESFKKSFRIEMGKAFTLLTTFRIVNGQSQYVF